MIKSVPDIYTQLVLGLFASHILYTKCMTMVLMTSHKSLLEVLSITAVSCSCDAKLSLYNDHGNLYIGATVTEALSQIMIYVQIN